MLQIGGYYYAIVTGVYNNVVQRKAA